MARADGLSGPVRPDGTGAGPGGRRRAPYRLRLIFAGVLLLLLLEILVLIAVGRTIGVGWTLLALVLFGLLGAVLVKRESGRAWKALRSAVDTGRMPGRELADASLVLVGGLLLLLPGFISDAVGIFLILPFTRALSRRMLAVLIGARVAVVAPPGVFGHGRAGPDSGAHGGQTGPGDIIEGEIIEEDPPPGR